MNVAQKNLRLTIVVLSVMILTVWAVFALSTEPIDDGAPTLNLGGVAPRIIIQDEEEETPGILPP